MGFEVWSPELQPVNTALITIPNSTISANILFIVAVRFTKSTKRTSTIFRPIFRPALPLLHFRHWTLDFGLPIRPLPNNLINHLIQLWLAVLPLGMLAQTAHRLANSYPERLAAPELRDEALNLRVVEYAWMRLVAFQRAGYLRRHPADEIGWHLHDPRRLHPQRLHYLRIDLVPGEHLVAGDVERLTDGLSLLHQARQPDGEVSRRCQRPGALAVVVDEHRLALLEPCRESVTPTGDRVRNPPLRVGVRGADDRHREAGLVMALLQPLFAGQLLLRVIPPCVADRRVLGQRQPVRRLRIDDG